MRNFFMSSDETPSTSASSCAGVIGLASSALAAGRFGFRLRGVLLRELGFGGFLFAHLLHGFLAALLSRFLDGVERQHEGVLIDRRVEFQHGVERGLDHLVTRLVEIEAQVLGLLLAGGEARPLLELGEVLAGGGDLLVAMRLHQGAADLGVLLVGHAGDAVGQEVGRLGCLLGGCGLRLVGGETGEGEQSGEEEEGGAHAMWIWEVMPSAAYSFFLPLVGSFVFWRADLR
jgi:hypothetical protein